MVFKVIDDGFINSDLPLDPLEFKQVSELISERVKSEFRRIPNVVVVIKENHTLDYENVDELQKRQGAIIYKNMRKFTIFNHKYKIFGYTFLITYDNDSVEVIYLVQNVFVL